VYELCEEAEYPEGVENVEITRRNNTLILSATAEDKSISKYTPTAQLKASVTENRVPVDEEAAELAQRAGGPQWGGGEEEEEEIETELVEYAAFKGDRETVLQNTTLQYEMFEVLRDIALTADKGTLTAITDNDGELESWRIVDGEQRPSAIEVTETPNDQDGSAGGVNWRDNKFIS
jgi:hypothetical protein